MVSKVKDAPVEDAVKEENSCKHHWIIEAADGATSMGICKLCGEEKEFYNWMPDFSTTSKRGNRDFELSDVIGSKPDKVAQGAESEEDAGIPV